MSSLYWFHAHRNEPKLHGIKLGCTTLKPADRMAHYSWVYKFEASKLEAVEIDDWLDLRKIETYLHDWLASHGYPRMNARLRPAEVFDMGEDNWEGTTKSHKWKIDDLMYGIYSGMEGAWVCISDD
jgi:hypothetical protein